jgi:hypothetical protein
MPDKQGSGNGAGSLSEAMSEQMWLELYRKAIGELAEGRPDFSAVFAGNVFDLAILFKRLEKGQLKASQ